MARSENITVEQKDVIRNLYLSGIGEEFIVIQNYGVNSNKLHSLGKNSLIIS
jgi:hypothetical protein